MVDYRSVSQVNDMECGYRYYLSRVLRVWRKPAAWLAQGTAFHEAVERFEKSGRVMTPAEVVEAFSEAYDREIGLMSDITPNHSVWFASGPYRGAEDIERRYGLGTDQIAKYLDYVVAHPEDEISSVDGTPLVEAEYAVNFGDVEVRGYIDQVVLWTPRDLKTGKEPGSEFQLATYAWALNLKYDIPVTTGDYWMAQKGGPTKPYDLTEWSLQELVDIYGEADQKIREERFDPNPSEKVCTFCDVSSSCPFSLAREW